MTLLDTILKISLGLVILTILFWLVARIAAASKGRRFFRKEWATDAAYLFFTVIVAKPLVRMAFIVPAALLVIAGLAQTEHLKLQSYDGFGPLSRQPIWLQAIEVFALADFIGYWSHRLFHRGRLWHFHAVHHSSEELDWLGSVRVHPVNEMLTRLLQATPILLCGFNPFVTLSAAPILTTYAIFLHADVNWDFGPLRSVIATPVFHRWHHSREPKAREKNFAGLLPVWDIIFRTYFMPRNRWPENFGIDEPMPKGLLRQLWEPFARQKGRG